MRRARLALLLIVALGLTQRLVGLRWGLPNPEHLHSYHPDEIVLVAAAMRVDPLAGALDPGFYNYGSLGIFLLRLAHDLTFLVAPPETDTWAMLARFHLAGRLLSVLMGTLTILLVFDIGRRLRSNAAGLAAAAILAVTPAHIIHSHYLTVDVPATFWATASLSLALRLLATPRLRCVALAGVCAGLAAATKYNAGLVLLAPLTALFLQALRQADLLRAADAQAVSDADPALAKHNLRSALRRGRLASIAFLLPAAICVSAAAAAFLAGCPGIFLNPEAFQRDFLYEARHVQTGHGLLFVNTLPGWIYHITTSLRFGVGLPLLAVILCSLVVATRRRSPGDIVLAAWALPYYLVIGAAQVKFLRYTIPLLPPLAVWAGMACATCLTDVGRSRARMLAAACVAGIGLWSLGAAVGTNVLLGTPDPRDRAAAWVRTHVPSGSSVGLTTEPWFYSPPLVPWNGGTKTLPLFEGTRHQWPYDFRAGNWTAERLERELPHCFIISDLEMRDALRLKQAEMTRLVEALERHYQRQTFGPTIAWPGIFRPGYPPEDWLYPAPTLFVYTRRAPAP